MNEVFDAVGAFLLGRLSYQAMAAFWPQVKDPADRVAAQFNSCPKYVVTETLADLSWAGAVSLRGDIPKQVAHLRGRGCAGLRVGPARRRHQRLMTGAGRSARICGRRRPAP